jgi:nitrogen fixation/metabolism regulation signal transduction histidine kinase
MIFNKLYFVVITRVLGILFNCWLLAYVWYSYFDILIFVNLLVVLFLQILFLVRKLNRINYDLESFFKAVRNNDSSIKFANKQQETFKELYTQFDLINDDIRKIKLENEHRNQYFKVLVEHVGVGLISFDKDGKVSLFNTAAKELFGKTHLFRLEEMERIQDGLSSILMKLKAGEQKLLTLYRNHEIVQLSLKATEMKMLEDELKLVSIQNIKNELDEKELDSWQKLIRVLTHEIMNSVSPVNSSISTLVDLYTNEDEGRRITPSEIDEELIADTIEGLDIIEDRTKGMVDFVSRFRDLTLLPVPKFQEINLNQRVKKVLHLLKEKLDMENVKLTFSYPGQDLLVTADQSMIDQVLINLINN